MNKFKSNARILFVIIVSAFIVIPITAVLLSKVLGVHEGMEDYDMTGKNVNMDRIDMSGVSFTDASGDDQVGVSGEYLYCIAGDISCSDGTSALTVDANPNYIDSWGNTHNSYEATCGTGQVPVLCINHASTTSNNSISFSNTDGSETKLVGPSGDVFKGFLGPYSDAPMNISDKYVYLYDISTATYSTNSNSACHLYGDCLDVIVDDDDAITSTTKCLADNGAKPGDPLCCGQDGVLQDTKYNCPSEYPHCIGYKCGETWGKCSTTEE
jgi:hypothetical protein